MRIEKKIGQMVMVGLDGHEPSDLILELIEKYGLGGVILFGRNLRDYAQIVDLCNDLQDRSSDCPLFISIDQEGGRVTRLPPPFTRFPAMRLLGACNSADLAYRVGAITALELLSVGINMDLAPVLDIDTNPDNPIIGDRSFGSHPDIVSSMGVAVISGLQDNGVIACGKHFPGHGDTYKDSHLELPVLKHNMKRLKEVELRPFQAAISNGLAAIMTGHLLIPSLDERYPATISKKIITDLLRGKMGFKGIVISDDLEMKAVIGNYEIGNAAVMSVEAGLDILLISETEEYQILVIETLVKAVKDGRIPEERLDLSYNRIRSLKERFLCPYKPKDPYKALNILGLRGHKETAEEIQKIYTAKSSIDKTKAQDINPGP